MYACRHFIYSEIQLTTPQAHTDTHTPLTRRVADEFDRCGGCGTEGPYLQITFNGDQLNLTSKF